MIWGAGTTVEVFVATCHVLIAPVAVLVIPARLADARLDTKRTGGANCGKQVTYSPVAKQYEYEYLYFKTYIH